MNGWRVTSVDHKPIATKVFAVHDEGFIRNDANADIERDERRRAITAAA
jgi:hypothetical protein